MRPCGVTPVASITSRLAPDSARLPRCIWCQSVIVPSPALYWHMGAMTMRFSSSRPPMRRGATALLVLSSVISLFLVVPCPDFLDPGVRRDDEADRDYF